MVHRPDTSAPRPGPRLRRLGVLVVVAGGVGLWGYVLYLSAFVGRADPRDELDDTSWAVAAEQTCAPSRAAIDDLPLASEAGSPAERAELLDVATAELESMVDRLDALVAPDDPAEARAVERWLADYRAYLQDRREYADRFRRGLDEPFRVTDRGGFQVDLLIDDFARVNDMESCATPDDVG